MVSSTAAVSGGHLNPAVTIAFWVNKRINHLNAIGYIIAQCLGAISAAFLIKVTVPAIALQAAGMGTPALSEGVTPMMGLITEIILTFFLMFVIYGTAVDGRAPKVGGLFIGLVITMDIFMGGPITGAAMNPARYLGPALMGGGLKLCWLYWVGPTIGAVLAAVVYSKVLEPQVVKA
jgi:aquaporin Z